MMQDGNADEEASVAGYSSFGTAGKMLASRRRHITQFLSLIVILTTEIGCGKEAKSDKTNVLATLPQSIQGVAWSPGGNLLAAMYNFGGGIQVVDRKGSTIMQFPSLQLFINPSLDFLDDQHIVTAPTADSGPDAMLDIWEVGKDHPVKTILGPRLGEGPTANGAVAFCSSRDRHHLAVLVSNAIGHQVLVLVDTQSWKMNSLDVGKLQSTNNSATAVGCSGDGRKTAVGFITGILSIVDNATLTKSDDVLVYAPELQTGVGALALDQDGAMVAAGPTVHPDHVPLQVASAPPEQRSNGVKILRTTDHQLLSDDYNASPVRQIAWSPSGKAIVVARDADVEVESPATNNHLAIVRYIGKATGQFADDGAVLAIGNGRELKSYRISEK